MIRKEHPAEKEGFMGRGLQWASLVGGVVITVIGVTRIVQENQWMVAILGVLIIAFSISKMTKTAARK